MFHNLLQITPIVEENVDSVKQAILDTAGKSDLEKDVTYAVVL